MYEASTETLFLGRQDAMQRTSLVPVRAWLNGRDFSAGPVAALEVGAGTGRFATFVKDNYPSWDLTLTDLSPFYLAEARSNINVSGWWWLEKEGGWCWYTREGVRCSHHHVCTPLSFEC